MDENIEAGANYTTLENAVEKFNIYVKTGETQDLKNFIESTPDINMKDSKDRTVLTYAGKSDEQIEMLLKSGADVTDFGNIHIDDGFTVLYSTSAKATEMLLEAGANPNGNNVDGKTLLDYVVNERANQEQVDKIDILLKHSTGKLESDPVYRRDVLYKVDVLRERIKADNEIYSVISKHKEWLQDPNSGERAYFKKADFSDMDLQGVNLSKANLRETDFLNANLKGANLEGADLTFANLQNTNLSDVALNNADLRDADLFNANLTGANLTEANLTGANLDGANLKNTIFNDAKDGITALHLAAANREHIEIGQEGGERGYLKAEYLLMTDKTLVNAKDSSGITPIHLASMIGDKETVELLVKHGAGVNVKDNWGKTPIHYATQALDKENTVLLAKYGAELNVRDEAGRTPLQNFIREGSRDNYEVTKVLLKNGAEVNVQDKQLNTPLHYAVRQADVETVKMLIENGAELHRENSAGRTPLQEARMGGEKEVIKILEAARKTEFIAVTVENIERTARDNLVNCKSENKKEVLDKIIKEASQIKDKTQKINFPLEKDGRVNIKDIAGKVREVRENQQMKAKTQDKGMEI